MNQKKERTLARVLPILYVVAGAIGLICAFVIMYEKVHLLTNPAYQPSCSLNPIISCGSVMSSSQAAAFGFPNPFIGLMGFSVVVTIGMSLLAGAKFKRWFWQGLQTGTFLAVLFTHWLFYQSVYNIRALCLYCIGVWIVTILIFWYTTLYNIRNENIRINKRLSSFVQKHHGDILLSWYLLIAALILHKFWYYWSTLI